MPVTSCFRTPFPSKRINGSQIVVEPGLRNFHATFTLMEDELSWKISTLVTYEALGLFGNTLTVDHMHFRH